MRIRWKPGQVLPTFDTTITVLNRRAGMDSPDNLDAWKKTVLHGCFWSAQTIRSVSGADISLASSYLVRVPRSSAYRTYDAWKSDMVGFTFSTGDIIVKGEVKEDVTPESARDILRRYPDSFTVSLFRDNSGAVEALEHYRLEGVR